jgi:hypothetical protein
MSTNLPADLGPYETEQQAAETTRDAYGTYVGGHMRAWNRARLADACEAAGVELGAYDLHVLDWMTKWEPEVCAVLAGIITRAAR